TREPKAATSAEPANNPGTSRTVYYSASGPGDCAGIPQYANLPCKVLPAAQSVGSGRPELLVKRYKNYNRLDEPTEVTERPGDSGESRTTRTTYDEAGREVTRTIEGGGQSVPTTKTEYSPT